MTEHQDLALLTVLKYGRVEFTTQWVYSLPAPLAETIEHKIRDYASQVYPDYLPEAPHYTLGFTLQVLDDVCLGHRRTQLIHHLTDALAHYEN